MVSGCEIPMGRRRLLAAGVGLGAGIGLAGPVRQAEAAVSTNVPASDLAPTVQTTEGPYYLQAGPVRTDITEGKAGVPLLVELRVLDLAGAPAQGASVDIWHCDASGLYSGYAGQGDDGRTSTMGAIFLRGSQPVGAQGMVAFRTIYPGWYRGRTTHIHLKARYGEQAVLTTQFFLPDALSEFLYANLPAYRRAQLRDTLNSTDGIALQAGPSVVGSVRDDGEQYVATLTLVVDPAAHPAIDRPPAPGEGPPPGARPPGPPPAGGPPPSGPPLGGPPPVGPWPGGAEGPPGHAALEGEARLAALVPPVVRKR